ncbi:AAA family ATPase [bacterium]|nr:AAA family ATPase [bacterium]
MSLVINDLPYEYNGIGSQNIIKAELFIQQNQDIHVLLVEEPENNLTYTKMCLLINKLSNEKNKQIFISTHSSFIANKLELKHLQLINDQQKIKTFSNLDEHTNKFFQKLPDYNVLRLILSDNIILVEGPSDELIIQSAYYDKYEKYPIDDGIDVMSVNGISFEHYCKLAKLIEKHITVVTDNDGKSKIKKEKFQQYEEYVKLCMEEDDELNTLEPSFLEANKNKFEEFRKIVYLGKDINKYDDKKLLDFIKKNKTD